MTKPVGSLSGGNKQKVSLGKWLAARPEILFIDEPTVGIDIRTKYEIHQIIHRLGEAGTSVVLISSDMPEMIRACRPHSRVQGRHDRRRTRQQQGL